jgi:tetratricopeptide (TPR) repeat protein
VTVGVNTGRVYFGPVGSSLHEELTVMGPVVNLAARLQGTAGAGEVIIGASTREHVRAAFDLHPLTLSIKGIDAPVAAFAVDRLTTNPDKVRGIEGLTAGLVGRGEELDTLVETLDAGSAVVAVVGEAGLGKTRLVRELRSQHSAIWVEGRCSPLTRAVPFSGFADALTARFTEWEGLSERLDELALTPTDRNEIDPFLRHLLRSDPEAEATEPALRRRLTIDALTRFLAAEAGENATVLFLDDIQWADPLTVDTIVALAELAGDLVLVVASRPEPDDSLVSLRERIDGMTSIRLRPLSDDQVVDLVRQLLTVSGLPPDREEALVAWAGGNPFYVEELIRSLIQRGMIQFVDERWEPRSTTIDLALPESIESLVMSRYDQLDTAARKAGQVAAVVDRPFGDRLFREVAGDELTGALPTLAAGGFVLSADGTWSFSHDLVKEAVYASLLPSQRRDLHHSVAEAIRRIDPGNRDALAFHFERTDDHRAAVEHLLAAAHAAAAEFANETASAYVERGLGRLELLEDEGSWRHDYLLLRVELAERAGRYPDALSDLDAARALVPADSPEAGEIWRLTGRVHRLMDDSDLAFDAFAKAEEILDPETHPGAWVAVQVDLASAMYFGGQARQLPELIERTGPLVERHGTPSQRAEFIGFSVFHRFVTEHFRLSEKTVQLSRRALKLSAAGADKRQLTEARFRMGFSLLWADHIDQAVGRLEQSLADARRIGDVMTETRAIAYLAIALRRSGLVEPALRAGIGALDAADRIDDSYYRGHAHAVIGWARWRSGDLVEAERLLNRALDLWGRVDRDGETFANVEFSWLAAWPLCGIAHERTDPVAAAAHLSWLRSPWERPMDAELDRAVEAAMARPDGETVGAALTVAERRRLL